MPIPHYLKPIAVPEKQQGAWTYFRIRCRCGCERFFVYQNAFTKEEREQEKPYRDALDELWSTGCAACTQDEDGTVHHWRVYTSEDEDEADDGTDREERREEVFLPVRPYFSGIAVIRIRCAACGGEQVLFDSRIHGYEAVTGERDPQVTAYEPHFRPKGKTAVPLLCRVENDGTFDEFRENTGADLTEEQYTDAFDWITVYRTDGKRVRIFDRETA